MTGEGGRGAMCTRGGRHARRPSLCVCPRQSLRRVCVCVCAEPVCVCVCVCVRAYIPYGTVPT